MRIYFLPKICKGVIHIYLIPAIDLGGFWTNILFPQLEGVPEKLISSFVVPFQTGFPDKPEAERHTTFYSLPSSLERTPTKVTTAQKVTFCSHGNSAFQPIASSCKIMPQNQAPNPESPGKSFQPITMSCKIVSGMQSGWHWLGVSIFLLLFWEF